jgi:hypothetical protein
MSLKKIEPWVMRMFLGSVSWTQMAMLLKKKNCFPGNLLYQKQCIIWSAAHSEYLCILSEGQKKQNKGDGRNQAEFSYEEPFGTFTESKGTKEFA